MGGLRICLDPGHSVNYNKGKDPGPPQYYESNRVFELAYYLKAELEKYKDVVVFMTKAKQDDNPSLWNRGYMAVQNNCDVFESIHTNAFDNSGLAKGVSTHISIYRSDKSLYDKMGNAVAALMKADTGVTYYRGASTRLYPDKPSWDFYGVIRAAMNYSGKTAVKHAFICEHGFHDNSTECKWLNNSDNLKRLAKVKAQVYADYFNLVLKGQEPAPQPEQPTAGLKVGDIVNFAGGLHYSSSKASTGSKVSAGTAKITQIAAGAKHPYHVISEDKKKSSVYGWVDTSTVSKRVVTPPSAPAVPQPYTVKVTNDALNIRSGPGTNHKVVGQTGKGVFTIVEEASGTGAAKWGKLKSGAGWVSLDLVEGAKPVVDNVIKLGDVVTFKGGEYYVSSTGGKHYTGKPGSARVTNIVHGAPFPYHVIRTSKNTTVYGWVKADLISK